MAKNYFKDLNLALNATASDVRTAYKKLAKQWHPDKNKESGAEDKFKQVLEAYNHLQSDDRRETHAREINRRNEAAAAPKPKPPPQPPPQPPPTARPKASPAPETPFSSNTRPKSSKSKTDSNSSSSSSQKNWWESFKKKPPGQHSTTNTRQATSRTGTKHKRSNPSMFTFINSFMNFDDPFDDMLFDIFMVAPERPPPIPKPKTDPFGNKLPNNIDRTIYDWKTATKAPGQMPDYQDYLDNETEFACHYCGLMMDMEMLRKHEPRCQRLGGKKKVPDYIYDDEDVNAAYESQHPNSGSTARPKSSLRKIKCRWCGESFSKSIAAEHIARCQSENMKYATPRRGKARPEWNNNFTETERSATPESVFEQRPRSAKINIDNFDPFGATALKACLSCKVKYGLTALNYCNHY